MADNLLEEFDIKEVGTAYVPPEKPRKSSAPVLFRVVVDDHDGRGERLLTTWYRCRDMADYSASLYIRDGSVGPDSTVTVQSSYTAVDGKVTWHTQAVAQRPRGDKWKHYCETHEFCEHCGQVVQKGGVVCGLKWNSLQVQNQQSG